jgi:hypothetical protein
MDLEPLRRLLRDESRRVLRAFLATHPRPTALGYVFSLSNVTPQLDLCAHLGPLPADEERWNSGDFDFPSGLSGARRELGDLWWRELVALHARVETEGTGGSTWHGVVALCGQVLLDLQHEGLVPRDVDLNVSEVGDPLSLVAARHAQLSRGVVPDAGVPWSPLAP